MIVVSGAITRPEATPLSLTITMPVDQWDKVAEVLDAAAQANQVPLWDLRHKIREVLGKVRAVVREVIEP